MRPGDTEPILPEPPALPGRTVLRQRWTDLAYFHWPYEPDEVQRLLPDGVGVDTFDGVAWVGLVPFVMRDVRIGRSPRVPYLGTFVEVNVRTYVVDRSGRRAVWFFSLDVPRAAIVAVARSVFALPYCWSWTRFEATGADRSYELRRRWPGGRSPVRRPTATIRYRVGASIDVVDELDHFLTARWALLTTRRRGAVRYGRVHHERWPLHRLEDGHVEQDLVEAAGLRPPEGEPRTACSPGVGVRVAWLEPG